MCTVSTPTRVWNKNAVLRSLMKHWAHVHDFNRSTAKLLSPHQKYTVLCKKYANAIDNIKIAHTITASDRFSFYLHQPASLKMKKKKKKEGMAVLPCKHSY